MSESSRLDAPIRAVVFDLFDTLVDLDMNRLPPLEFRGGYISGTAPALHAALKRHVAGVDFDRFAETLATVDREFRETRYAVGLELPTGERFATLVERLGYDAPELVEDLTQVHMTAMREHVETLDHHPGVLARLHRRASLALCSNFSHSETALRVLKDAGLYDELDAIVVSDIRGIRKPRPEIFEETLEAVGATREETLHVGDNLAADVGGAAALGIRTVWLTRRIREPADRLRKWEGPAPDFQFRDLTELEPLLERLGRPS